MDDIIVWGILAGFIAGISPAPKPSITSRLLCDTFLTHMAGNALKIGAMLFVVSDEIIPESHRYGHERPATFGLIIGFLLMIALATFLA